MARAINDAVAVETPSIWKNDSEQTMFLNQSPLYAGLISPSPVALQSRQYPQLVASLVQRISTAQVVTMRDLDELPNIQKLPGLFYDHLMQDQGVLFDALMDHGIQLGVVAANGFSTIWNFNYKDPDGMNITKSDRRGNGGKLEIFFPHESELLHSKHFDFQLGYFPRAITLGLLIGTRLPTSFKDHDKRSPFVIDPENELALVQIMTNFSMRPTAIDNAVMVQRPVSSVSQARHIAARSVAPVAPVVRKKGDVPAVATRPRTRILTPMRKLILTASILGVSAYGGWWLYDNYGRDALHITSRTAAQECVVTADVLNLRQSPSTSAAVLGSLVKGSRVTAMGKPQGDDIKFFSVSTDDHQQGYAAVDFLDCSIKK